DRLGHQSARTRNGAQELQGGAVQGHDLGQRCALHDYPEPRGARETPGDPGPDGVSTFTGGAGLYIRRGLLLSRPGGQECAAVDGTESVPGRSQGIRASGIRRLAQGFPADAVAAAQGAGRSIPHLGPAGRRSQDQVTSKRRRGSRAVRAASIMKHDFSELKLDHVTRRFAGAGGKAFNALDELTLTVKRGEFIALLGPSGCGKSTALNCIAGLMQLSGGTIHLDDTRIDTLPPEKRGFGMVFQNYALFPHMSVEKNIGFGLRMRNVPNSEIGPRVERALKLVQLVGQA